MQHKSNQRIYTVSQLTEKIKHLLEDNFPFIWINGEISNLYPAASGHRYFDLKDTSTTIKAVIFKGQVKNLQFDIENGLEVIGFGRISVYGPRGTYQLVLEYLEPAGVGALHLAFEQLKKKLAGEGLFDEEAKKQIPPMTSTIGVVTSLSGAVIHDITKVLYRRFPNLRVIVAPAMVQGADAPQEIVTAIEMLNRQNKVDIIIVARGGGSLEDLQAFNSEIVARAIYASHIPIVSAVGHETDYTIADFVADLRAPTPSAAAEMVVPEKKDELYKIEQQTKSLMQAMQHFLSTKRHQLQTCTAMLKSPRHHMDESRLSHDHLAERLYRWAHHYISENRHSLVLIGIKLKNENPVTYVEEYKQLNQTILKRMSRSMQMVIRDRRARLSQLSSTLTALSPMAILERGYSITRTTNEVRETILDANQVVIGQSLEVLLGKGALRVDVKEKKETKKPS